MKRVCLLLLCLALLLTCGCQTAPEPEQPFLFYYRRTTAAFSEKNGVIAPETVDLGSQSVTVVAIVSRYLLGPSSDDLQLPFPRTTELVSARVRGSTAEVILRGSGFTSEINASVADACLAKTLLQLAQIEHVSITLTDETDAVLHTALLSSNDIVLYDDSSDTSSTVMVLYFTDESRRYLLAEKRTVPFVDRELLPQAVVDQLLLGPKSAGMVPTMPEGAAVLDLYVENGVCSVDFNRDFLTNKPDDQLGERMTLLSLIDSLTDLEEISAVQIYVEGRRLEQYTLLNAALIENQDVTAIGPVRSDLSELDASVYLSFSGDGLLHLAPMRVRTGNNETAAEAIVRTLTETAPLNGFRNPLYQARVLAVSVQNRACTVDFAAETSFGDQAEGLRSLIATLTQLDQIDAVLVLTDGVPVTAPAEPDPAWFCTASE